MWALFYPVGVFLEPIWSYTMIFLLFKGSKYTFAQNRIGLEKKYM